MHSSAPQDPAPRRGGPQSSRNGSRGHNLIRLGEDNHRPPTTIRQAVSVAALCRPNPEFRTPHVPCAERKSAERAPRVKADSPAIAVRSRRRRGRPGSQGKGHRRLCNAHAPAGAMGAGCVAAWRRACHARFATACVDKSLLMSHHSSSRYTKPLLGPARITSTAVLKGNLAVLTKPSAKQTGSQSTTQSTSRCENSVRWKRF